jgi:hypothetical protein
MTDVADLPGVVREVVPVAVWVDDVDAVGHALVKVVIPGDNGHTAPTGLEEARHGGQGIVGFVARTPRLGPATDGQEVLKDTHLNIDIPATLPAGLVLGVQITTPGLFPIAFPTHDQRDLRATVFIMKETSGSDELIDSPDRDRFVPTWEDGRQIFPAMLGAVNQVSTVN